MSKYIKLEDIEYGDILYNFATDEKMFVVTKEDIESLPTIEIVRCKDCKHYQPLDYSRPYDCSTGLPNTMPTDYCSYGERIESEE